LECEVNYQKDRVEAKCPELREIAAEIEQHWASIDPDSVPELLEGVRQRVDPRDALWVYHGCRQLATDRPHLKQDAIDAAMAILRVFPIAIESDTTGEKLSVCEHCGHVYCEEPIRH
jgi:hypothetical protein